MENIISAFIGLGSAIIVAIITGIFQLNIAKKNRIIAEKQFEQSRKQYSEKIEQLRLEQKKTNATKANEQFLAEINRFYQALIKEMLFYELLLNELHYLNNIATPKSKEFRIRGAYPYIDSNLKNMIEDISLPQDIAVLLGALRANISLYNASLKQGANSEILEEGLERIYNLIDPINTQRFENYTSAQKNLRSFEINNGKEIIQNI